MGELQVEAFMSATKVKGKTCFLASMVQKWYRRILSPREGLCLQANCVQSIQSIMGATLKRRDGSGRVWSMVTGVSGFSKFIDTDLLYSGFYPFPLFADPACYNVASWISNVATGNGHDHITQVQGQLDCLDGADTDQSGRAHSLSGKPNLRPQAGRSSLDKAP